MTIDSVNGLPFSLTDTYAVVVNDFMAGGGDTYSVLGGLDHFDTGVMVDELVADYISEELGGVITKENTASRAAL